MGFQDSGHPKKCYIFMLIGRITETGLQTVQSYFSKILLIPSITMHYLRAPRQYYFIFYSQDCQMVVYPLVMGLRILDL